mmetsp:Transcript_17857/g.20260  ORF Transcript_17857/g.20260 Transcript_17857/m.20260 type:complete len:294 (+) Transcript_17857:928-1809(+)
MVKEPKSFEPDSLQQLALAWGKFADFIMLSLPPGPRIVPFHTVINFQKATTGLAMLLAMVYFNNFSLGCWIYTGLHGTYGLLWCFKEMVFPDQKWRTKITIPSCLFVIQPALIAYWLAGYLMVSGQAEQNPSAERIALCVFMCIFGSILMMCADLQKNVQLKFKKGLVSDGLFTYTRNPNYLGEMMIYGSFAILVGRLEPFIVLATVWSLLFFPNMFMKDQLSLRKKEGWTEYQKRSWLLLPKFAGSTLLSLIVYGGLTGIGYGCYVEGSFAGLLLKLRPLLLECVSGIKVDL